jgi:membrane protease YdiL (CAAX protease family)
MGMVSLGGYQYIRRLQTKFEESTDDTPNKTREMDHDNDKDGNPTKSIPSLLSTPSLKESPWKNVYKSKFSRLSSFLASCALFQAYFWTGRFSIWWEDTFYYLANFFPMTVAMHRSLCVLFGHLSWIAIGFVILRAIPRPQSLFRSQWYTQKFKDAQWLWWTIGGYFVSSWFFNIADFVNQWVLPLSILEQAQDSVVTQLINPEFNDWLASAVGYIAPCITAPWWEEVLYRGFLLPALTLQMKYKWAVFWNGAIFAIHHMSPTACIPLAVLGWTWSIIYAKSGNLLPTILIHAMWNSRIFLGSWLGL